MFFLCTGIMQCFLMIPRDRVMIRKIGLRRMHSFQYIRTVRAKITDSGIVHRLPAKHYAKKELLPRRQRGTENETLWR